MPLNIKDDNTHEMAKKLAGLTGMSISRAVKNAIQEKIELVEQVQNKGQLAEELDHIALYCSNLPILNNISTDEILGYDDHGLPT
ncbi:type II toxin-antitoxin system VapB family antitoxin [Kiloniella sp.]|uniref:type II toxin-antitoxin system VapB family antitoxin n=1 Tax=Kiloniella sp. TaxID=1938587 RepID=UPI003B020DCC